jgi:U3 small nucleolar RNA-associated protein 6
MGQRRVFFILERATKKFPGDLSLWMQYIDFARQERANKKLEEIFTNVLRLHPIKTSLWIYAAKYSVEEQNDYLSARNYLQRGLRFCSKSQDYWLEYTKLEILFTLRVSKATQALSGLEVSKGDAFTTANLESSAEVQDQSHSILSSVTSGAIPLAVFDSAMEQFPDDEAFTLSFIDLFSSFEELSSRSSMIQHVIDFSRSKWTDGALTWLAYSEQPLIGSNISSSNFPANIRQFIARIGEGVSRAKPLSTYAAGGVKSCLQLLRNDSLAPSLHTALLLTISGFIESCEKQGSFDASTAYEIITALDPEFGSDVRDIRSGLLKKSFRKWPFDESISMLQLRQEGVVKS